MLGKRRVLGGLTSLISPITTHSGPFSRVSDDLLIRAVGKCGWGNWVEIMQEVNSHPETRFDWWLKSRSERDVKKRLELLVRALERKEEKKEEEKKEPKKEKKKKEKKENKEGNE
ncbi:ISWI chromatin-remodeling complex ATPase ISW2 [Aduncisulcus paluster]|nr:ISWI chromatin-remodeling complex ATPase ISW2 [Aduncisulcus paluster]